MQDFTQQSNADTMKQKGDGTMASAKFDGGKCKGGSAAKALMRHNDISIESRKIAAIENPHIDISKSHLNFSLDKLTYQQRCEKYDKRINELDSTTNTNKRKDRVTMQAIEIPRPADLPEDKITSWFSDVYQILINSYGADNVIYADVHMDEVHDYIDSVTEEWKTSREHGHFGVVPEVDGVLNGKAFFSRKNMRILNNSIETMTKQKYNCKFMTGEKRKSKETINQLKTRSEELQLEEKEQQINFDFNTIETEKKNLKNREAKFEKRVEEETSKIRRYKKALLDKKKVLDDRETVLDTREANISASEAQIQLLNKQAIERLNNLTKLPNDDYSRYAMGWMKQHGYSQQCFNDYCIARGLNDSFTREQEGLQYV